MTSLYYSSGSIVGLGIFSALLLMHVSQARFLCLIRSALFVLLAVGVVGCANAPRGLRELPTKKIDELRRTRPEFQVIKRRISRRRYEQALENQTTLRSIRLVPILKSAAGQALVPEYRLFDIQPDSAYTLLGMENADVLVAAEGYVVVEPEIFPQYAALLKEQKTASIELRRSNQPILLEVSFVD